MRERCCVTENGKRCVEITDITIKIFYGDYESSVEFDLCMTHYDELAEILKNTKLSKVKDKSKVRVELI
jgi:glycerol-3-phosphate dehydrogenase